MEFVGVKYRLKRSENFEEYLKYIGVGLLIRKAAASVSPVCCLTKNDDDTYTFVMNTPLKDTSITFRPGEEFEGERMNGEKVTILITMDSSKLIEVQIDSKGIMSKIVREFSAEQMVAEEQMSRVSGGTACCMTMHTAGRCLAVDFRELRPNKSTIAEGWDNVCIRTYEVFN